MSVQITDEVVNIVYDEWMEKGFPYYPTDHKWRQHEFNKLVRFDRSTIFKPKDSLVHQSPHGLSLAWSYMPHSWDVKCGWMRTPRSVWEDEEAFKKGIRKILEGTFWNKKNIIMCLLHLFVLYCVDILTLRLCPIIDQLRPQRCTISLWIRTLR